MYEERERFSLKDVILQIVLVVLFVFLLLWLFPTKSYVDKKLENGLNPLYNQLFSQNVNSMKEAAISYFTTPRLPKKIGDKEKLTLGDMLDKKLLIPFLDSNNKQCSLTDSYVEITKMDDEYILKVNLSCSDNSDYILVHLGCYSYCESGLCEKKETTQTVAKPSKPVVKPAVNKNYEYEYELVIDGKWGDWSNWSEWSTAKVDKTDYRNVKTKEEVVVTDTETIKVGTTTKVIDAKKEVSYYCPKGYTQNGTKCSRQVTTTDTKDATAKTKTTYNCNAYSGYTLDGTLCKKTVSTSKTETINATKKTTYGCPSGYTLSGDTCSKEVTYVSSYKKGDYVKTVYNASSVPQDTKYYFYEPYGSDYVYDCNNKCAFKWVYTYKVYKAVPVYKTKTETAEKTSKTTYSCPSGYTLSGTKCNKTVTNSSVDTKAATAKTTTTYSCPSGYTLSGTKCNKNITTTQTINASENVKYSCSKGELVGKSCISYEDKYETFNVYSTITYYSYQTREFISGDRKTVWSTSQNDKNLIGQGYKLTGNSKEI